METLRSYLSGGWHAGSGETQTLINPATEAPVAETSAAGLDLVAGIAYARERGGPALRALRLGERGKLLSEMAAKIHAHRDELLDMAMVNGGNTRSDAKFDVDGAIATLTHYAELGASLGDAKYLSDGESVQLGSSPRLSGRHVWLPRPGVALLVNAFNFPAWGLAEKAACALLAGMPVVVKPATSTAVVAHRIVALTAELLPAGALSLVCGPAHALPGLLGYGDVIAFTGSSDTARALASLPSVLSQLVRLNVEADSLNGAVLAPAHDDDTYDLFLRDVVKEMTQKTGQKCTAIRRIFVPEGMLERVRDDLIDRLAGTVTGDPAADGVRMGPLATKAQQRDVLAGIAALAEAATPGLDGRAVEPAGVSAGRGCFVGPTLLCGSDPSAAVVHELEVFGPVATLLPAPEDPAALCALIARGRGGLVCSFYGDDRQWAADMLAHAAAHHGRVVFGSKKVAGMALYPGMVLPQLLHGGPGRAGGGAELGGLRGLELYSQRVALQGDRPLLDALVGK